MLPAPVSPWGFDREAAARAFSFLRQPYSARSKSPPRLRGRKGYTVCRKARGQFPNSPCDWPNPQVEGAAKAGMWMPYGALKPTLYPIALWGRGPLPETSCKEANYLSSGHLNDQKIPQRYLINCSAQTHR
jgi:hypothetical protein